MEEEERVDVFEPFAFGLFGLLHGPCRTGNRGQVGLGRQAGDIDDERHRAVAEDRCAGILAQRFEMAAQRLDDDLLGIMEGVDHQAHSAWSR